MKNKVWERLAAYLVAVCLLVSGIWVWDGSAMTVNAGGETTIYFYNDRDWSTVNAYMYADGAGIGAAWPGQQAVAALEKGDKWFKVTVPFDTSGKAVNVIFNDNSGSQVDIYINDTVNVYTVSDGTKYASAEEVERIFAPVSTETTVYLYNAAGWENVYAYVWNPGEIFGGWPGQQALQAAELGQNWWKINMDVDALATPVNLIFNNNAGSQTDFYLADKTNVYATTAGNLFASAQEAKQSVGDSSGEGGESGGSGAGGESGGEEQNPNTVVHFLNHKNWTTVFAYTYANGADLGASWPGITLEKDDAQSAYDWRSMEVPAENFGLIFTDGGSGRVELAVDNKTEIFVTGDGAVYDTAEEALIAAGYGGQNQSTVVYFYNSSNWQVVNGYVYANDTTVGKGWPGAAAEAAPEVGAKWFKITVPKVASADQPFSVIFNNGVEQVKDTDILNQRAVYTTVLGEVYESSEAAEDAAKNYVVDDGCEDGENQDLNSYPENPGAVGAGQPYITYEAEQAATNAEILNFSTRYSADIQSEAGGRSAVKLNQTGDYVEFTLQKSANAMVLRYSMPDSADGSGMEAVLSLYVNGAKKQSLNLTSKYAWIYGSYPYTNTPAEGKPHRFFDESRVLFAEEIPAGSTIRLQKDAGDTSPYYIIDFVEAELVESPLAQPQNSLSIVDFGATPNDGTDDYAAIEACIAAAKEQNKEVWIPGGKFRLENKKALEVQGVTIRGAGMWYSELEGAGAAFRYKGTCKFYDFAMTGVTTVRDDSGDLAGFEGVGQATNVTVQNVWMEHMKVGIWSYNTTNLVVQGCRIRNTYADGINLCSATNKAVIRYNSIRNTGDDGIAIWPWMGDSSNNIITRNTVQMPTLANGIAIYGGTGNTVTANYVADSINNGSGICLGTDYDTANGFGGMTTVQNNTLVRCGSYHTDYEYPIGALWIWATKAPMTAEYLLTDNTVINCSYEAVLVDCWNRISGLTVKNLSVEGRLTDGIYIRGNSQGSLTKNSIVAEFTGKEVNNEIPEAFQIMLCADENTAGKPGQSGEDSQPEKSGLGSQQGQNGENSQSQKSGQDSRQNSSGTDTKQNLLQSDGTDANQTLQQVQTKQKRISRNKAASQSETGQDKRGESHTLEKSLTAGAQSQADRTSLRSDAAKGKQPILWIFLGTGGVVAVAGIGAVSLLHAKAK